MGERKEHTPAQRALAATELGTGDPVPGQVAPTPISIAPEPDDEGPDLFLGKVLGGLYKVDQRIGEGGMGTVYAALHVHLNKHFAIKVLSSRIAADKQAIERLRQEAVLASSIDHDNIVDVVSFDTTDDGDVFIVMELLKGAALADVLEKGPVPLDRALHIGIQICNALHAAHENGIVHRDLKPENVFIVRKHGRDFVKVLDFGISKVKSAEAEQVRMTKTGQLVGTPLYMSPEQARGEADVDRRVDIYALGVILYEMLTGAPPFEGGNYFQLLWKHGNEPVEPPSVRAPDAHIPASVEAAIIKALAKLPAERYGTMAELEAALAAVASVHTPAHLVSMPSIRPSDPRRPSTASDEATLPVARPKLGLMLGAGALVVALVAVLLVATGGGTDDSTEDAEDPQTTGTAPVVDPTQNALENPGALLPVGVEPPETDVPDPEPTVVSVNFRSQPGDTLVTVAGEELGRTPLSAPLPLSDGLVEVTFSKDGYISETISVDPVAGAQVEARLRPLRRRGGGMGGMNSPPIKTSF